MKVFKNLLLILFCCLIYSASIWANQSKIEETKVIESYGKLPLYFIRNNGQVDEKVRYYEKGAGKSIYFARDGVYIVLSRNEGKFSEVIHLKPLNANMQAEIIAEEPISGKVNYFLGNDRKKWRTNIPAYGKIRYREIYPGIDMVFYGNQKDIEYDIIIKPGADPKSVKFEYKGAKTIKVGNNGDLIAVLSSGIEVIQKKPEVYQEIGGKKVEIEGNYVIREDRGRKLLSFKFSNYNPEYALVIDPVLSISYSTYLGGMGEDKGYSIAVDLDGNAYVTGETTSTSFPVLNPYQGSNAGSYDVFVTKLNPTGGLVYSTYLGGSSSDYGRAIAVDSSGNAYLTGWTSSTNFPIQNGYQGNNKGGWDAFIAKLSPSGDNLIYSTYIGGSNWEGGDGIAVDSNGNVYITGWTQSDDFPTLNAFQEIKKGYQNAFITKLNPTGGLVYSTYLGGSSSDYGRAIAVDLNGSACVTGNTWSNDFPILNAFQQSLAGPEDAFATKLNPQGNSLVYSTYLGGSSKDEGYGIAVDSSGNAYLTGRTWSNNFPVQNGYQGIFSGLEDAFVTKLSPSGSLIYSTYLGGNSVDEGYGIAVDSSGNAYVTGYTSSTNFPTQNGYQESNGGSPDAFATKINPAGDNLIYSTYLGGSSDDYGRAIAVDSSGIAYVTGFTNSNNFPTQNPYQGTYGGGSFDAFIIKIGESSIFTCTLTVVKVGAGSGTVTSEGCTLNWEGGIGTCTVNSGTQITLTAVADTGSVFTIWTGGTGSASGCTGTEPCTFTITEDTSITAVFNIKGDISGEGQVDVSDVILCLRQAIGIDPQNLSSADMNGDGNIDISDVILILRKAIGLN